MIGYTKLSWINIALLISNGEGDNELNNLDETNLIITQSKTVDTIP
jgi:hypothetical protein